MFLPGESQGRGSLVDCCLWGHTESDMTEVTQQQQQQQQQRWCLKEILGVPWKESYDQTAAAAESLQS